MMIIFIVKFIINDNISQRRYRTIMTKKIMICFIHARTKGSSFQIYLCLVEAIFSVILGYNKILQ